LRSAHRPEARSVRRLCIYALLGVRPDSGPDRYAATDILVQVCLGPAPVGLEEAVSAVLRDEHRFHPGFDRPGLLGQRKAIVVIEVQEASDLVSPAYDDGTTTEAEVIRRFQARFARLHERT
jgi:hypothetical protein